MKKLIVEDNKIECSGFGYCVQCGGCRNRRFKIELLDYDDYGFEEYGTQVFVNGVEMPFANRDRATIIRQILEYLGYEVEVDEIAEFKKEE